jgi:hypothetical protein
VARRPLVFVLLLTVGDYLVWNWSLNGNHDVIALASGLSLPPLALASIWLLAISGARLLGALARRPPADAMAPLRRSRGYGSEPGGAVGQDVTPDATAASSASSEAGSRKIAA